MSRKILPAKYVSASLRARFDFLSDLGGDTITSAVCTATVFSGFDGSPSAVISGSASFLGGQEQTVFQTLTGGVGGVIYLIACAATTNAGRTFIQHAYMAVLPDGY